MEGLTWIFLLWKGKALLCWSGQWCRPAAGWLSKNASGRQRHVSNKGKQPWNSPAVSLQFRNYLGSTWLQAGAKQGDSTAPSVQLCFPSSLLKCAAPPGPEQGADSMQHKLGRMGWFQQAPSALLGSLQLWGDTGRMDRLWKYLSLKSSSSLQGDCCYTGYWIDPPSFRFFISILPERKLLMFVFWGLLLMTPTLRSIRLSCLLSSHCLPPTSSKFVEMGQSRNLGESSLVVSELCLP